ncbi:MAG: BNR-4 repeat-containing protein [Pirellulales bacterium]|nr:BNR-4 repeat-containing protein [Pirellulales bacterium]
MPIIRMLVGLLVLFSMGLFLGSVSCVECAHAAEKKPGEELAFGPGPVLGGCGGAYFLASSGELVIDVYKRDLNHSPSFKTELRAILVGPDRQVIQEVFIPDDGKPTKGPGPLHSARLTAKVKRKGLYGLNITVSQDRYGSHIAWGFRTNCPRYCIETARGHRDRRHQEPIELYDADTAGNICFIPRAGKLKIEAWRLPKQVKELEVFDADGKSLAKMKVDSDGYATHTFSPKVPRDGRPWRLYLPAQNGSVEIDGLTRWDKGDAYPDMAIWSNDINSLFPLAEFRWLLSPYREKVYARADSKGDCEFTVFNNTQRKATVRLSLEFPDGDWPVELRDDALVLRGGERRAVKLFYRAPHKGETRSVHLRVTPDAHRDFTTYSTLTVSSKRPAESSTLKTPILLRPYESEDEAFGNHPRYPLAAQPYFDLKNRPFMRVSADKLAMLRDGVWVETNLAKAVKSWTPAQRDWKFDGSSSKVAFDRDNNVYVLSSSRDDGALLQSSDGGRTFTGYVLPQGIQGGCQYDIEQFSGHNTPDGPPPVLRCFVLKRDPSLMWRRLCRLELFVPEKDTTGRISWGKPILLSEKCLGFSFHSGIPSSIVSRGGRVHVTWAEATDPKKKVPGAPAYVATYDKKTKTLSKPVLVAHGPPANDVHNSPSITMDSRGYLHVLAGTHGQPFPYARSLKPNDSAGGWTKAVTLGKDLRQTYIGLVCTPNDSLHAAFRLWGRNEEPFPLSIHARLAYQCKPVDGEWGPAKKLVVAAFSEYSVFYHRLTIDRRGRLFLSYRYWSTHWFYRNDRFHDERRLLMSGDGGETWRFVKEDDFR